ncbi:MAG: DUF1501 domain-containing protein [Bdellovibrionales bacterium]|nr:DUF1501 domain-containing protein [Bdellovibrionales bacterium]NQZ18410.1 DUF1501 domain-containing protein [Bdellovibrionales bacterium]
MSKSRVSRRTFINSTLALGGAAALGCVPTQEAIKANKNRRIIYVMLPGGMDALSVLHPTSEDSLLNKVRKETRIAKDSSVIWDNYRGHQALRGWQKLWDDKQIKVIHQSGHKGDRSHANCLFSSETLSGQLCFKDSLAEKFFQWDPKREFLYSTVNRPHLFHERLQPLSFNTAIVDNLHSAQGDVFQTIINNLKKQGPKKAQAVLQAMQKRKKMSRLFEGATNEWERLARLIGNDYPFSVAYMSFASWDTHAHQNSEFHDNFTSLVKTINKFTKDIGPKIDETLIVITSEFGRAINENGNKGTEHGQGGLTFLIGGRLKLKPFVGEWRPLRVNDSADSYLPIQMDARQIWDLVLNNYLANS